MKTSCRLNNKSIRNIRNDQIYQAIMIDLCLLGAIEKDDCEMLLGSSVPRNICLPDGRNIDSIDNDESDDFEEYTDDEV